MARPMQDCAILFGDSLTELQEVPGSFHERMSKAYIRKLDVLNRGFGGYTTLWARQLVDQIFARVEDSAKSQVIRLVTIWYGTNDAVQADFPHHVPLEQFRENLEYILNAITSSDSPYAVAHTKGLNIVLITPAPIALSLEAAGRQSPRRNERTKTYRDVVMDVGEKYKSIKSGNWKLATIDMWSEIIEAAGGEGREIKQYFTDGVHYNTSGYQVLWDNYLKVVKHDLKGRGINPEDIKDLPYRVPREGDIDYSRPESVVERMDLPTIRKD